MNEGERFLRFCDELDQANARGLASSIAVPVLRWIGERIQLFESLQGTNSGGFI
jgi:hypothetical protein